jgi:hypothetical protein
LFFYKRSHVTTFSLYLDPQAIHTPDPYPWSMYLWGIWSIPI